jgi:hypothetical protein
MDETSQVPRKERLHVHKVSDCARFRSHHSRIGIEALGGLASGHAVIGGDEWQRDVVRHFGHGACSYRPKPCLIASAFSCTALLARPMKIGIATIKPITTRVGSDGA